MSDNICSLYHGEPCSDRCIRFILASGDCIHRTDLKTAQKGQRLERFIPCCPECDYSGISKPKRKHMWVCKKCGWAGKIPNRRATKFDRNIPKYLKPLLAVQREKRKALGVKA